MLGEGLPELDHQILPAFLLTLGGVALDRHRQLARDPDQTLQPRLINAGLSFSAGGMLFVSFVEIFPKARDSMTPALGGTGAYAAAMGAFSPACW